MGGSASNEELLAKIIELERIPEPVRSFIHTDNRQTKLGYNLAWAKTYLKPVGAPEERQPRRVGSHGPGQEHDRAGLRGSLRRTAMRQPMHDESVT